VRNPTTADTAVDTPVVTLVHAEEMNPVIAVHACAV
jgi:hypothetical protein